MSSDLSNSWYNRNYHRCEGLSLKNYGVSNTVLLKMLTSNLYSILMVSIVFIAVQGVSVYLLEDLHILPWLYLPT